MSDFEFGFACGQGFQTVLMAVSFLAGYHLPELMDWVTKAKPKKPRPVPQEGGQP